MGKVQHQQRHICPRSIRHVSVATSATQHHLGKHQTSLNLNNFARSFANVMPTFSKTQQTGKPQVPVRLTGSSIARTHSTKHIHLHRSFRSFIFQASPDITKTQQQSLQPHTPVCRSAVPASAMITKTQQQRCNPQTNFCNSAVPTSATITKTQQERRRPHIPFCRSAVPASATITKTQQKSRRLHIPFCRSAVPVSATITKTQQQSRRPHIPLCRSAVPASATITKTQQQRRQLHIPFCRSAAPTSATITKTQQQSRQPHIPFCRSAVPASTTINKTQQQRRKPQTNLCQSAVPASATITKTQQRRRKPQTNLCQSAVPASAMITKTQQRRRKPQTNFCKSAVPASATITKTQQQSCQPQTNLCQSAVPASAMITKTQQQRCRPHLAFNSTIIQSMIKSQQQKGKPQTPLRPFALPMSTKANNTIHQRSKSQTTSRSIALPLQATVNKTNQQRESNFSAARHPVTINNTQQQKRKRRASTFSSNLTEHKRRKLQEPNTSSNTSASGKLSRTSHQSSKAQAHIRSTSAPASACIPKGTSRKQDTACLRNKRKKTIDNFFATKVDIDKREKKESVKIVDNTLSKIMSHVKSQSGGDIYCPNHVKAGSYPVNAKIGKADEFDTNICLNLGQKDVSVRRNGTIKYAYPTSEHSTNMNVKCELGKDKKGFKIPNGNAVATVSRCNIPESLRHGNDLVPREMRYDLYHKIRTAINQLKLKGVYLSRDAHGPALRLIIHRHKHSPIKHDISVDVTLSLPCDEPIKHWPRRATRKAFSESLIKDVKDKGTHLVPKKNEFWSVSYSRAERELFSKMDKGNGCRKFVYKILKKHLQTCKSRSSNGLPGLSSHILKTQLLWSCEKHTTPGYWHYDNRDICLIDTIFDLEETLRSGRLFDYFDTEIDVLKGKDSTVLKELNDYLHTEKCRLENMQ